MKNLIFVRIQAIEETFIPEGELEEPELFGEGIFGQAVIQDVEEIQAVEERYAPAEYTDIISYVRARAFQPLEYSHRFIPIASPLYSRFPTLLSGSAVPLH